MVQFAKTGDPNIDGKPAWPPYKTIEDHHLVMDETITVDTGLRSAACDLMDEIAERLRQAEVIIEVQKKVSEMLGIPPTSQHADESH